MKFFRQALSNILVQEGQISHSEDNSDNDYKTHFVRDKMYVDWIVVSSTDSSVKFSLGERVGRITHFRFSGACSRQCMESFVRILANTLDMDLVKREDRK